MDTISYDTVNN